jgi:hypothetical protein
MAEPELTPWQTDRDNAEATGDRPPDWGPFHRHFCNDAIHRDGGPECDQPGTPRRVYVFDEYALDEHERIVARWGAAHPEMFPGNSGTQPRSAMTGEAQRMQQLFEGHCTKRDPAD